MSGHIYDAQTGKPIEGVHVGWGNIEDPDWKVRLAYDSLTKEERDSVRKATRKRKDGLGFYAGVPLDDSLYYAPANRGYRSTVEGGYEYYGKYCYKYYTDSYSDANGYFATGPRLVGASPTIFNIRAVFLKDGYKPTMIHLKDKPGSARDSFVVYMHRE